MESVQRIRYPPFDHTNIDPGSIPITEVILESNSQPPTPFKIGTESGWLVEWRGLTEKDLNLPRIQSVTTTATLPFLMRTRNGWYIEPDPLHAVARNSGADLLLSSKPVSANVTNSGVEISLDINGEIKQFQCRMLCGADGAHSWVRRTFKMGRPKELLIGFQIEVTGYPGEEGRLDLFTGDEFAPGFFAWAIPSGNTTRIGNWSLPNKLGEESCEDLLQVLMKSSKWKQRFSNCKEVGRYCGPVPSGMIHKPVIDRVAVFGDAAGLCKPTTGGGIGKGFEQVDLMLPKLVEAISTNDFTPSTVKNLNGTLSPLRRNQNKSRALRNVFLTESTDEELDELFSVWSQPEVIDLINQLGDIDNPIPLGMKMLKDVPEFRRLASKAAAALIWG